MYAIHSCTTSIYILYMYEQLQIHVTVHRAPEVRASHTWISTFACAQSATPGNIAKQVHCQFMV